jgi:hypothetical protein
MGANRNGAKRHYQRAKILQAPSFSFCLQVMCNSDWIAHDTLEMA